MSRATELAEHIHDMFVSNWGFDSPLAQDSTNVLATLRQQEAVIKWCVSSMENCLYAVSDVALTDDLNDYCATLAAARECLK